MTDPNSGGAPAADAAASAAVAATPDAGAAAAAPANSPGEGAAAEAVPLVTDVPNPLAEAKPGEEPPAADGEKKEGEEDKKPEAEAEAPDYTKLEVPAEIAADDPAVAKFKETVAELKLPVEAAQALISKVGPEITKMLQQPYETYTNLQKQWREQAVADPEIGGAKEAGVMATIGKVLARFGTDPAETDPAKAGQLMKDFQRDMMITGAGRSPAVIKMFHRMAAQLSEGAPVNPGGVPKPVKNPAEALYPSHKAEG